MLNIFTGTNTIQNVISIAEIYLINHNISSSKLNCEILLCEVLNISRLDLRINSHQILTNHQLEQFEHYIRRRANNEPLQYIIGFIEFYNMRLQINKYVFIPRPETEYLVSIIANADINPHKILDICTGSGCISFALYRLFNVKVEAIDISFEAIELANDNKKKLGLENINFINCSIEEYFENEELEKYDLIVCNPPYVTSEDYAKLEAELFFEPRIALTDGADGLTFYKLIAANIHRILSPSGGKLYFECGINQAEEICNMYKSIGFKAQIIQDFAKINRYICIY